MKKNREKLFAVVVDALSYGINRYDMTQDLLAFLSMKPVEKKR